MSPQLIDIGANLTHESFAADRDAVLARAAQAGVVCMIVTGADLHSSRQAAELAHADPARLRATAGVHPHHAHEFNAGQRQDFEALLAMHEVVAVGECGLDYYRNLSPPAVQRMALVAQLEMAVDIGKPVFLHQRDAHLDFLDILKGFAGKLRGGVAHCFTGGCKELEAYVDLGLSIGVTGWVCDERRGHQLREAVPHIPEGRLMIETDAPYLLPRDLGLGIKTRRNEPSFLPHIAASVARLRGESVEHVAALTTTNATRFFRLDQLKDS